MLKSIIFSITILLLSVHANETTTITDKELQLLSACDKIYDDCSADCEKSENNSDLKCFAQCEILYDECQQKIIIPQEEDKSVN